jgi:SAM-dependent methyltransferase
MQNSYDLIADKWHAYSRDQGYIERALAYVDQILRDVPANATVLDLGCGTGLPIAQHIVQKGFRVVGVDQSKKMLEIARREVPEAEFIHGDMIEIEFNQRFAGAVAWDSAFHVERKYHSAIYRKLAHCLQPGARLLLSVGGTGPEETTDGAEGFTSEMFGETFFYSAYEPAVARKLIEREGFEIELWEVDDPTSRGHIAVIARKMF